MIRPLVATTLALTLSGCALLSSPEPVQLYRFGSAGDVVGTPVASPVQVKLRAVEFPSAARGDRLLGVTGTEAAYIGGARWVSPALVLYSDSVEAAFAAQARSVRLIGQQELTPTTHLLDIDVRSFEARYNGVDLAPTVVMTARVRLLRFRERTVVAEETFTLSREAGQNRVSAIVEAFDAVTGELNTRIVTWTDANAGGG